MIRRAFLLLTATIALAACAGANSTRPAAFGPRINRGNLSTAVPPGRSVAILAPLTGPNAERGASLVKAAELALAEPGSPKLIVQDTGGTAAGAAGAAKAAIAAGAGIIIGPLTAGETAAVAAVAQPAGVPVLAFTSDPAQARSGVWTLGLTPGQQVNRLVSAMAAQGRTRFAALLPSNEFGRAMGDALGQAASAASLPAPKIQTYAPGNSYAAARDLSNYTARRAARDAEVKAAQETNDNDRVAELSHIPLAGPPFEVLLLAEYGAPLASLTSGMQSFDIGPQNVRVVGPALWSAPAARGGAAITGGYYAAPDPALRNGFDTKYTAATGSAAPGLADFAFDAAAIAKVLFKGEGYSVAALCRPEGFAGVDGVLALQPDGSVRRGLALFQIKRGGPEMIEPAPETTASPGI